MQGNELSVKVNVLFIFLLFNMANLEFIIVYNLDKNYLSWVLDAEIHLDAMRLEYTI